MLFLESVGRRETEKGEFTHWVQLGDKSLNGNEYNRLFRNKGDGVFEDVAYLAGADRREDGRSAVAVDVDADGDLDLVVHNLEKPVVLLINEGTSNSWLQVRLRGTKSNRDAIGARVVAEVGPKAYSQQVRSTAGYLSGCSLQSQFGLGAAKQIDRLTVYWPSGARTILTDITVNQRLLIEEGTGVVTPVK